MALTVEEIKIRVTSEQDGLKKLNSEVAQLEAKIKSLQSNTKGNVKNFKWFKDLEQTLANGKIATAQLQAEFNNVNTSKFQQATSGAVAGMQDMLAGYVALNGAQRLWQLSLDSARFKVLRDNFTETAEDINLFRTATAGTVDDASLIKLSNQASDLGVGLQDQAILFSLAEDAADKYGTSIEEGFQKVIFATEGNTKGLKSLGIQKGTYEEIVKSLTEAYKKEGIEIDAEMEKQIRIEAILKASGKTIDDVKNKVQDSADKHEQFTAIAKNLANVYGGEVFNAVTGVGTAYEVVLFAIDKLNTIMEIQKNIIMSSVTAWENLTSQIPILGEAISWLADRYRDLAGAQSQTASKEFIDAGEDFVKAYDEQDVINSTQTRKGKGFTSNKKKIGTSNKTTKETTEEIKNLGKEASSVEGALLRIAQLDLSTIQPMRLADDFSIVRERIIEDSQLMAEALSNFANSSITAMGAFFGSFVPPQNALTPIQQLLKSVLLSAISAAEGLLFAGGAVAFFKAILSGGITLGPDIAFKTLGLIALEAAKGFVGAFEQGTDYLPRSGYALVGEGGPELLKLPAGSQIFNNSDTKGMISNGFSSNSGSGSQAVYISANIKELEFTKRNNKNMKQRSGWKRY